MENKADLKLAAGFESKEDHGSMSGVAREVADSLKDLARSEFSLARAEIKDMVSHQKSAGMRVAIFGGVAALGVLPFLSFLVLGLGRLLGDNYWLSSLLVAVTFFAVGGGLMRQSLKQLRQRKVDLPRTRLSLESELEVVKSKFKEISDDAKRRIA